MTDTRPEPKNDRESPTIGPSVTSASQTHYPAGRAIA